MKQTSENKQKHIVVVGGGFAGVEAAISLRKKKHKVTLISDRDYFFIYPISIWIPTGRYKFKDASMKLDRLARKHGFNLIIDEFTGLDQAKNMVFLKGQELSYDYLVIATGAWKVKHPGIENTLSICGHPEQALLLKDRFDELIEKGGNIAIGFGGNPKDKSAVRGGPAFEILFNMMHEAKRRKASDKLKFTFFAPMAEPGKRMGKSGYKMLGKMLDSNNIESRIGKKIKMFEPDKVVFEDDSTLNSDLTMFIPASSGPKYITDSTLPVNEAGFVKIDGTCKVEGSDNIYAAGDVSALEGPEWKAKQGHLAVVKARFSAYNIDQQIKGSTKRKDYRSHINILCVMDVGNGAAWVYRKGETDYVIPLPIIGHWMKIAWGIHYKFVRLTGIGI